MKHPFFNRAAVLLSAVCLSAVGASATIIIPTVPVGNAGNAADPATGFGQVNYAYNIGTNDVTSSQYCAFLNAVAASDPYGIYHPDMAKTTDGNPGIIRTGAAGSYTYSVTAGRENLPATEVSYWNANRFVNWLSNGQPNAAEGAGTTETGTYNLFATQMDTAVVNTPSNKNLLTTSSTDNNAVVRNTNAIWAVTSGNEWYKAAYYDPQLNSGTGGYFQYATMSNTITTSDANYATLDSSTVGAYGESSYYGTLDQAGNVFEWNENIDYGYNVREIRGGAFNTYDYLETASNDFTYEEPFVAYNSIGFRVTELLQSTPAVPEPTSIALLSIGATAALLGRRKVQKQGE